MKRQGDIDNDGAKVVIKLLDWLSDGWHGMFRYSPAGGLVRWFIWNLERDTEWDRVGSGKAEIRFKEVVQAVGKRPLTGDAGLVQRIGDGFEQAGQMWGIGAIDSRGRTVRLTCYVPPAWMDDDGRINPIVSAMFREVPVKAVYYQVYGYPLDGIGGTDGTDGDDDRPKAA
jgi:hypothetical protein